MESQVIFFYKFNNDTVEGLAMVGVLVARFYSWVSGCRYVAELPACGWEKFAAIGGLVGAVTLPAGATACARGAGPEGTVPGRG